MWLTAPPDSQYPPSSCPAVPLCPRFIFSSLCPLQYYQLMYFSPLLHCSHCGTITTAAALMAIDAASPPHPTHTPLHTHTHMHAQTFIKNSWQQLNGKVQGGNLASLRKNNKCHPANKGRGTCCRFKQLQMQICKYLTKITVCVIKTWKLTFVRFSPCCM